MIGPGFVHLPQLSTGQARSRAPIFRSEKGRFIPGDNPGDDPPLFLLEATRLFPCYPPAVIPIRDFSCIEPKIRNEKSA